MQNNKKRNNRNKKPKAAKKVDEDDWEEMLTAPLPNDESTADMTHSSEAAKSSEESKNGKPSGEDEYEDADDDT